jgi:hypothetical protein
MNNAFAFLPMRSSNELLGDPGALRARLDEDSYLLFRDAVDQDALRRLRAGVQHVLASHGWADKPNIPMSNRCLVRPLREFDEEYQAGYQDLQKLEPFHTFAHREDLLGVMRDVVGPTAFPHPLKIARIGFPDHFEASTPPHQDFPNNQGTPNLTAAWIPLMDVPVDLGGLAILRGSHRWGVLPLARHLGAGNRCAAIPDEVNEACRWVTTDFQLGDVLLFPSTTVHAALHNSTEFDFRFSVDYRYQQEGEPLTPIVLEPHFQRLTWDEIYEGWESSEYQYYWRDLDFEVVPFEEFPLVDHELGGEFSKEELKEIYRYHERVDARTARRLAKLAGSSPQL